MEGNIIEISIVYKDNFSERFKLDHQELEKIIREVKNENQLVFHIGGKQFIKKDIAVVATPNHSIQFI